MSQINKFAPNRFNLNYCSSKGEDLDSIVVGLSLDKTANDAQVKIKYRLIQCWTYNKLG